jgi:hypothetical protein
MILTLVLNSLDSKAYSCTIYNLFLSIVKYSLIQFFVTAREF